LTGITVEAGNPVYDSRENCNAIIETASNTLIAGCKNTIIPSSIITIGVSAFYDHYNMTSIEIPNSVTSIGEYAFAHCSGLTAVTISNSVTSIGKYAFEFCRGLTSVNISNSVTSIGVSAFNCCSSLTSIFIPISVTSIGSNVFSGCSALTAITVEDGNTVYDSRDNCNAIIETASNKLIAGCQNTLIPSNVTSIGTFAFYNCSSLTSLTIPNSVTSIDDYAFSNCGSLISVTIPNSVTRIGYSVFARCSSLTSIYNYAITPQTMNSTIFSNVNLSSCTLHVPCGSLAAYQAANVWKDFTNIQAIPGTEILDPDHPQNPGNYQLILNVSDEAAGTVTGAGLYPQGTEVAITATANIGYSFTQWSDAVTDASRTITLLRDSTLTAEFAINRYTVTFVDEDGTQLSQQTVEHGSAATAPEVEVLQCRALAWDTDFSNVTSDLTVTAVWTEVLIASGYTDENCDSGWGSFDPGIDGSGPVASPKRVAPSSRLTWKITCDSVLIISGEGAMDSYECYCWDPINGGWENGTKEHVACCMNSSCLCPWQSYKTIIKAIQVEEGVTEIGGIAFSGCTNLTAVSLPSTLTTIGEGAFAGCSQLTAITIPDNVTNIWTGAFSGCTGLTEIIIPNKVTYIARGAFDSCTGLTSITIPSSVTTIGGSLFRNCNALATVVVEAGNTVYDSRNNCNAIIHTATNELVAATAQTIVPEDITAIGEGAFAGVHNLTFITLPAGVTSIGSNAFAGCDELAYIEFMGTTPPSMSYAFFNATNDFYVPCGTMEAYVTALDVNADQVKERTIDITYSITSANTAQGTVAIMNEEVNCDNRVLTLLANAKSGYEFLKWSDDNTENPRTLTVTTNTTLQAQWIRAYTITWKDADGTTLATDVVRQGVVPTYTGEAPIKVADAQYTYTFNGWTPDIVAATADATYTATYTATLNEYIIRGEQNISDLAVGENTHIIVEGEGHLVVDAPTTIGWLTLTLDGTPSAQVTGIENLTASTIDAILTVSARQWFALGVPFDVSLATGIRINGANAAAIYGTDYVMDEYDGALRASTQDGWKRVASSGILHPGTLYMIYTASATAWRLTAANPAAIVEAESVAVAANPSSFGDHHAGWNAIANPRLSNASASLNEVNYATLYDNQNSVYDVVILAEQTFVPAEPFFVQTPAAGSVLFAADDAAPAPWRVAPTEKPVMIVALTNEAQTFTDKAYLSIVDDKQNGFLIGHDLEKMQVAAPAVPQLWVEAYNMHLAACELPFDGFERVVPIGMYAPVEGDYTIAINNVPNEYVITLLKSGQAVWTISEGACVASLQAGNNADYALRVIQKHDVVTGMDDLNGTNAEVRKMIIDGQIYILRDGKTYTVQGGELSDDKLRK